MTGTFLGLAENARFDAGGGTHLRITYHAGSGSDVALIVDAPPTVSAFTDQTVVNGSPLPPMPFTVADDLTPLVALGITRASPSAAAARTVR